MPNIRSAVKRTRTSEKRRAANKSVKGRIAATRRKLHAAVAKNDKTECSRIFRKYCSQLDKAVKKGTLKANAASRRKSVAAKKMRVL